MREIIADRLKPNIIGRYDENIATLVKFPLEEFKEFEIESIELVHQRYGDTYSYECVISHDDNYAYWIVKRADLAKQGIGKAELTITFGDGLAKGYIYETRVLESLADTSDAPEPYIEKLDEVIEKTKYAEKVANMSVEAESISSTEEAEVIKTELEDRINLKFRLPKGEPAPPYDDTELREMIDKKASIIMLHSVLSDGVWSITDADGNTLTYADIKALHNKEDYIVCLHQNVIHSTSFLTDAIEFMGTYYINDNGYISRLIINDANVVKADGYALENAENRLEDIEGYEVGDIPASYPSTDALVEYLKDGNNLPIAGTTSLKRGTIFTNGSVGMNVGNDGYLRGTVRTTEQYTSGSDLQVISKGTLNNVLASPSIMPSLTSDEKKSARERFGIVTLTQEEYDALTDKTGVYFVI